MGAGILPNEDDVVVYSVPGPLPPSAPHRASNQTAKPSSRVRRRSNSGARQPRRKNSGDDKDGNSQTSLPPSPELHFSQQAVQMAKPAPVAEEELMPILKEEPSAAPKEEPIAAPKEEPKPTPKEEPRPTPKEERTPTAVEKPENVVEEVPVKVKVEKPSPEAEDAVVMEPTKAVPKAKARISEPKSVSREAEHLPSAREVEQTPVARKPESYHIQRTSPLSTRRVSMKAEEMATSYFDLRSPSMEKLPLHDPINLAPAVPALPTFIVPEPVPSPSGSKKVVEVAPPVTPLSEPSPTPVVEERKIAPPPLAANPAPPKESTESRSPSSTSTAPSAHRPFLPDYTRHIRKRSSSTTSQIKVVDDRATTPNEASPIEVPVPSTIARSAESTLLNSTTQRPDDEPLPPAAPAQIVTEAPSRRLSHHPNRSSRIPASHSHHDSVVTDSKSAKPPIDQPKAAHDQVKHMVTMAPLPDPAVEPPKPTDVRNEPDLIRGVSSRPLSRAPVSSRPRRSDRSHRLGETESNSETNDSPVDDIPTRPRAIVLSSPVPVYKPPIEVSEGDDVIHSGYDAPSSLHHVVDTPADQSTKQGRFPILDIDSMTPRSDAVHSIRDRHVRRPSLQVDKIPEIRSISPLELEKVKPSEPEQEIVQPPAPISDPEPIQRQEESPRSRMPALEVPIGPTQPERTHKLSGTSKPSAALLHPSLRRMMPDKVPTLAKINNPVWSDPRSTQLQELESTDFGTIQLSSPIAAPAPLAQPERTGEVVRPSFIQTRSSPAVVSSTPAPNEFDIGSPVIPFQRPIQPPPAPEETDWPGRTRSRSNAREPSIAQGPSTNPPTSVPPLRSSPTPSSRQAGSSPVPAARTSALPSSKRLQSHAMVEPAPVEPQLDEPAPPVRRPEAKPVTAAPPVPDAMQKPLRSALRNTSHQSNRHRQIVNEPAFESSPPPPVPKLPPVVAPPPKAPSPIPPPLHHRPSTPGSSSSDVDPVAPVKAKKGGLFRQFWKGESKPPTIQPSHEKSDSSSLLSRTTSKQKDPVPILSSSAQRSSPVPPPPAQSVKYSTPIPRSGGSNSSMPSAAAPSSILRKPPPKDKGILSSVNNLFGAKRQHRTVSSASLEAVLGASVSSPQSKIELY